LTDLPPDVKRRIYEEEKVRIEAEEKGKQQRKPGGERVVINLETNVAGLLCYALFWVSGVIFLIIEPKNRFVRFHAIQSVIVFGLLHVTSILAGLLPFVDTFFCVVIGITAFILWIVLMFKAVQSQTYKLPCIGYLAKRWSGATINQDGDKGNQEDSAPPTSSEGSAGLNKTEPEVLEKAAPRDREIHQWHHRRWERVTTSSLAIAWSIVLLIFFHFFNQYLAFYRLETESGVSDWIRYQILTPDFNNWLPILTAVLVVTIIVHIILLVFDKRLLRETVMVVLNGLGVYTVASLLAIFPFSFGSIPDSDIAGTMMPIIITIVLIGIVIGFSIGTLVGFIRLIVYVVSTAIGQQNKVP
jgi:uncharacterized membrane protein